MKRLGRFLVVVLISLISMGCGRMGLKPATYDNTPVPTPIQYKSTGAEGGLAEDFLKYMLTDNFKSAYALLYQNASIYQSSDDIKEHFQRVVHQLPVHYTEPGIRENELVENLYLYCFPATVGDERRLITIWVESGKVTGFIADEDFELAEQMICALISEDFESCEQLGNPQTVRSDWEDIIEQTGKYISTNPPYLESIGDATIYRFPSQFDNGDFFIDLLIGSFPQPGAMYFEVNPA